MTRDKHGRVIERCVLASVSMDAYNAAERGETVLFQGFDWENGQTIWMQLAHKAHYPDVVSPPHGFTEDGFFVRPVPRIAWPKN